MPSAAEKKKFSADEKALRKISERLEADGLEFSAETLFAFARKGIEAREKSKFEFTKNLSAGLELVAEAGEKLGFTRKEMSYLEISEILGKARELWEVRPGDLIFTGTPPGEVALRPGDRLHGAIAGVGTLDNVIGKEI